MSAGGGQGRRGHQTLGGVGSACWGGDLRGGDSVERERERGEEQEGK